MVIGLYVLGAFLVNKASADFIDFLHYDAGKSSVHNTAAKKLQPSNTSSVTREDDQNLRIVKVGSHVLRNQLLAAGCIEAHQVEFIKCQSSVLDRELDGYHPVR